MSKELSRVTSQRRRQPSGPMKRPYALALPPQAGSVTRARHWVSRQLHDEGLPVGAIQDAELCVSELAANAVAHATTDFLVEIQFAGDVLRITVSDLDDRVPRPGPRDPGARAGRGLLLVATISSGWGVSSREPLGKSLWFELPIETSALSDPPLPG